MREEQWMSVLELQRDIERAARHIQLEWPEVVDSWEDMASDIMALLVKDNQGIKIQQLDPKAKRKTLHMIGQQIASSMRDDYEHFTGNYLYSTNEVRSILGSGILKELTETVELPGTDRDWAVGDKKSVTRLEHVDVLNAFNQLEGHHRGILIRRFNQGEQLDNVDRKDLTRAVDRLTDILNRTRRRQASQHNGPGSRKAISNSRARQEVS